MGWSHLEITERSGVWLFRGALQGENLFSSLDAVGGWVKKGSYRTAWSVPCDSSCTCSYAYGQGLTIGPHTGERCWPLLAGLWRAIAPLMKPWCAEGEVPTFPEPEPLSGMEFVCGWHCDDEPLFGECGEAKLIVSVSLGRAAVFKWRRQSCPDDEGHLCWLGHSDILVMDGQWARMSSSIVRILAGNKNGSTLRSAGSHNMFHPVLLFRTGVACCLPTCAQGSSDPVMGNVGKMAFWFFFLVSSWCLVHLESPSSAGLPVAHKTWVSSVLLLAGHALWAEVGGGITFVTSGETAWHLIKRPSSTFCFRCLILEALHTSFSGTA